MKYLKCSPGRKLQDNLDDAKTPNLNPSPCRFYVCQKEDGLIVNCIKFKTIPEYRTWMGTQDKFGTFQNLYFETFCDCDPKLDVFRLMACHMRRVKCENADADAA